MTTQYDWAAAKAAMLDVATRVFGEVPRDRKVRCPFHADGSPSLHVYDDGWHCYGCGEGGDAVDLVARLDGVSKAKALETITGGQSITLVPRPERAEKRTWDYAPGAEDVPVHPVFGPPAITYRYHRDGQAVGAVARWDLPGGRKEVRPLASVRDHLTGEIRMEWVAMQEPRPLYRPEAERGVLVVVEGEKCAEVLRSRGVEACTWPGGSQAWRKADWSMVTAPKVILWPDADQPGIDAIQGVAAVLQARGVEVRIVDVEGLPAGHDAADDERMMSIARLKAAAPYQSPGKAAPAVQTTNHPQPEPEPPKTTAWPFRCLGHRNDKYFFWVHSSQRIITLSPSAFTRISLLQLAPVAWWEGMFPDKGKKWSLEDAAGAMMTECDNLGIYEEQNERGRGIWRDGERIVYHHGNGAIVDGLPCRLSDISGRYAYPIAGSLPTPAEPLNDDEARRLILDTFRIPSWHDAAFGEIIAGWVLCGLLAGVIKWRPSVWVNGAAGSGKSEVLKFAHRLLESFSFAYLGNASEAGIRQDVGKDARPIIIDEAEPGADPRHSKMTGILTMLRQASSDTSARVVRGTASGEALRYHVRSPFLLGSIQVAMTVQADRERITLITLRSSKAGEVQADEAEAIYQRWLAAVESLPDDTSRRLLARALKLAPIARETIKAMTEALIGTLGNRREADQIGTLMAGAWLLQASHVPDQDEADMWVHRHDWTRVNELAHETDAERARSSLLGMMTIGDGDRATVSDRIAAVRDPMGTDKANHERVLAWYGLRVFDGWLFVTGRNDLRKAALKESGFSEVSDLFRQLKGHQKTSQRVGGETHRGVLIPLS